MNKVHNVNICLNGMEGMVEEPEGGMGHRICPLWKGCTHTQAQTDSQPWVALKWLFDVED